jgi:RNA polymerase sigma-70 factor (ECF subfamily)
LRQVLVDDAIVEFLQNPTEASFVSVFQILYAPLWRYFTVRGLDSATAEELVQDVLLTVYRRAGDVRNHVCFTGWLFHVARNCLLQHVRKRRVMAESLTSRALDHHELEKTSAFQVYGESELFEWMQVLDDDEREICAMRYMEDFDYQSIGEALEIPMGTVKWKLHQVKRKIAAKLGAKSTGRK